MRAKVVFLFIYWHFFDEFVIICKLTPRIFWTGSRIAARTSRNAGDALALLRGLLGTPETLSHCCEDSSEGWRCSRIAARTPRNAGDALALLRGLLGTLEMLSHCCENFSEGRRRSRIAARTSRNAGDILALLRGLLGTPEMLSHFRTSPRH